MTDPTCVRCEKPMRADQAYACGSCGAEVRACLARTAKLAGQAMVTIAKLDHVPRSGAGRVDDLGWWKAANALEPIPLPYNASAAEAFRAAGGEMSTWARHCCETRGIEYAANGLDGLCSFLASQVDWLRHRPEADEALKAIEMACKQVERIVDRRADAWYAGPCSTADCPGELYPLAGAESVSCPGCGECYSTAERKAWLLEEARDVWGNATWLAATLSTLGVRCTDAMVRGYAHRGRLAPHPEPDGRGYLRYRLGSVLELLTENLARRSDRASA